MPNTILTFIKEFINPLPVDDALKTSELWIIQFMKTLIANFLDFFICPSGSAKTLEEYFIRAFNR